MAGSGVKWKKGRGKLGILSPLIGSWRAEADSKLGPVVCTRTFERILDGGWVQLTADWHHAKGSYRELALFGVAGDDQISFWSFTSDGKHSRGTLSDATDVHPQAIAFEAQMPAGLARTIYWPGDDGGVNWAVESKGKKGWNRFTEHHYTSE